MFHAIRVSQVSFASGLATWLCIWASLISPASAQVNGPGPSPANLFDIVINSPGDAPGVLGSERAIGGVPGETTQLNVNDGGRVDNFFTAAAGSEVNISGGTVRNNFYASAGSEVNISGGTVDESFRISGGVLNVSGGTVGLDFATTDSQVNLSGGAMGRLQLLGGSDANISGGSWSSLLATDGSVVNITAESVGRSFIAETGSEVNISGGITTFGFTAESGSEVNISGGTMNSRFRAFAGSDVELIGGEFSLNGADFSGNTITLANNDVLTGRFADGSVFIFRNSPSVLQSVNLTVAPLPELDLSPIVINSDVGSPPGLQKGQALTLQSGGSLGVNFAVVDATLNIEGGTVGPVLKVFNSQVNISQGTVGNSGEAHDGSIVNVTNGVLGDFFVARSGSKVNISGGNVGSSFIASSGSEVNISGGVVGSFFRADLGSLVNITGGEVGVRASEGSEVNISGGSVRHPVVALPGSDVELIGGEFVLNGADFSGSQITLTKDDVLSGTFADGTVFIFAEEFFMNQDSFTDVTLTTEPLPAVDFSPIVINNFADSKPLGLRAGQTLTLQEGGSLRNNFSVVDATLNIEGGTVGEFPRASNSLVNISGGNLPFGFDVMNGTEVNISGGTIGVFLTAYSGSEVNISGGNIGTNFTAESGSEVNISGGIIGRVFSAEPGSNVNIFGQNFFIDGVELDNLTPGEPFTITDRDVTLTGVLSNGDSYFARLNSLFLSPEFVSADATFTVTLESPVILGDVNQDGVVNFLDIAPFISVLSTGAFQTEADMNQDDTVNFLDISPFITELSSQ